jgi:glycosyl-4,4'-diaponeurosporenoate acyltransferase
VALFHVQYSGMPTTENVKNSERILPRLSVFDVWFRPKGFESERLYERLGALLIKRYVPTGGDLVMQRLRRHHPGRRWVTSSLQSLCRYERRTRLNESIHLIGFMGFTVLAVTKFASGSLSAFGLAVGLVLNLLLGLWPVVLQRYNRLRLYRAINLHSRLSHRHPA